MFCRNLSVHHRSSQIANCERNPGVDKLIRSLFLLGSNSRPPRRHDFGIDRGNVNRPHLGCVATHANKSTQTASYGIVALAQSIEPTRPRVVFTLSPPARFQLKRYSGCPARPGPAIETPVTRFHEYDRVSGR